MGQEQHGKEGGRKMKISKLARMFGASFGLAEFRRYLALRKKRGMEPTRDSVGNMQDTLEACGVAVTVAAEAKAEYRDKS